ncbi:MAG: hypothetical protein M3Z04_12375 [Chloroflexota bacterium]|nr:hypothetical protein [Chloroflexota bacterium]
MTATLPAADRFRLALLVLLIGQMFVYYDTAYKTIPNINLYLLANLVLIVLALIPWQRMAPLLWLLVWPLGALARMDWILRPTQSDVFWATSQGVDFLLHGRNPYTQVYTWVYQHQPGIQNYPAYSYFPGSLLAEIPFYLLGNVRWGLGLADLGCAVLIYLLARDTLTLWSARALAAGWLLFVPAFQVPLRLGALDFLLLFWIALAVWLYRREWLIGSACAAAMAFGTKQYGFLFAVPWGILLLQPLRAALWTQWQAGSRRIGALIATLPRRLWLPPLAEAGFAALLVVPLALLSPKAFIDATIANHLAYLPDPMLGTPQWNESIAAQIVALRGLSLTAAGQIAGGIFVPLLLIVLIAATLLIRTAADALRWAALATGVTLAFNNVQTQFFYWRLPLLLFLLYYLVALPPARPLTRRAPARAPQPPLLKGEEESLE